MVLLKEDKSTILETSPTTFPEILIYVPDPGLTNVFAATVILLNWVVPEMETISATIPCVRLTVPVPG